jgi:DNA repair protein RecO (recombination protein O)
LKQSAKALFLHKISYSESSLITVFYTREFGLQHFLFQGGKKKAASLYPCALCELTFYKRPDSDLGKLTEAKAYRNLHLFVLNPLLSTVAFFIADVLRNALKTEQSDQDLYDFLESYLVNVNEQENLDGSMLALNFLIEFAVHMGIEPLVDCTNKRYFYLNEGSFSNVDLTGDLVREGNAVFLIQGILRGTNSNQYLLQDKRIALEIMIRYYELHIPNFNVDRSLTVIREVLYT